MHYCGIIIKPKNMSVEDAREVLGGELVQQGRSDWYSIDNYRERTFGDRQEITIKEFNKKYYEEFFSDLEPDYLYPIVVIADEGYWDEGIIPHGFYEYWGWRDEESQLTKYRNQLLELQKKAYLIKVQSLFDREDMMVCLLDYHN